MATGFCEQCEREYAGSRCPVCGRVLLQEINPEEMPAAAETWHTGYKETDGPPWPAGSDGEPEEPALLTEMSDLGGRCQLLQSKLRAYSIPSFTRYPGVGELVKMIIGFSGHGVQVFVPASRLEEAGKLFDLF